MTQEVSDRPAERSMMIQNIIGGALLIVLGWVGMLMSDIQQDVGIVKEAVSAMAAAVNVNAVRIEGLQQQINDRPPEWLKEQVKENTRKIERINGKSR